jgi:DNA repair exonuclease SbcCD ATPase subunit
MSKDELMDLVEEQRKSLEEKDRQIEELERRVEMAATMARTNCASQIDAVREMAKEQSRQLLMVLGNDGSPAAAAAAVAVKQRGQSKQVFPL